MKNIFAYILIAIVVGIGGYLAFFPQKHSDQVGTTTVPAGFSLYSSDHVGLEFLYPDKYEATSTHQGSAAHDWHTIVLMPKGYVPPQGGEGPPVITVSDFPNPQNLPLDQWVLKDPHSNWQLSDQDGGLGSTSVGGEPALTYRYSGLYENSAVVVARNGKVYMFTAGWLTEEDATRSELQPLLNSVKWLESPHE